MMTDKQVVSTFEVVKVDTSEDRPMLVSSTGEVMYVPQSYYLTMQIKVGTSIYTYSDGSLEVDSYKPITEIK